MPELPEVETIKRVIEPQIVGLKINELVINHPKIIDYPTVEAFHASAVGQSVCGMERRGKFLVIYLSNKSRIILHLRMTGCLLATPKGHPAEKHTHIIFGFDNETELRFSDMRRFGRFWLIKEDEEDKYSGIGKLGIEPFDKALTGEYLCEHFGKRRKTVKECLLEQGTVSGIGNIYSDEILFTAGVHPNRAASSLSTEEWEKLAVTIPERLDYYIEKNKITPEDYLQSKGRDYRNTPFLQVYGHAGKPCPKCGEILCKTVIGGRSSVFCPSCQINL